MPSNKKLGASGAGHDLSSSDQQTELSRKGRYGGDLAAADMNLLVNVNLNVNVHKKKFVYNTFVNTSTERPTEGAQQDPAASPQMKVSEFNYQKPIRQTRRNIQSSTEKTVTS